MYIVTSRGQIKDILKSIDGMFAGVIFWKSPLTNKLEYMKMYSEDWLVVNDWVDYVYEYHNAQNHTCCTYICTKYDYRWNNKSDDWSDYVMGLEG